MPRKITIANKPKICIHHSAGKWGDDKYIMGLHVHGQNGYPPAFKNGKPGYHALILNGFPTYNSWRRGKRLRSFDGNIQYLLSFDQMSNGVKYGNRNTVNLCLMGDYNVEKPSSQMLARLFGWSVDRCYKQKLNPFADLYGHGELMKAIGKEGYVKPCPGKYINMVSLRIRVADRLRESKVKWVRELPDENKGLDSC